MELIVEVYDTHYQMLCHNLDKHNYVPGISRTNETRREKTNVWHIMRKQRRRLASR